MTTFKELTKKHGEYKIAQVKYLSSLYELIEQSYDLEELCSKSRTDLRMMNKQEARTYELMGRWLELFGKGFRLKKGLNKSDKAKLRKLTEQLLAIKRQKNGDVKQ